MSARVAVQEEEITSVRQEPARVVKTTRIIPQMPADSPRAYQTKKTIFRTYQVLYYVLGIIEILLAFRLALRLIGANPGSGFTRFIYAISGPFAAPFLSIVPSSASGGSVLEWSTLIAMAVYAVGVWLIIEFFQLVKPVNPDEVTEAVDSDPLT